MRNRHESGFSLVELLVAMVCTLIVTGAVYGLLTGGQNAFRREPELSDRQQNIRAAMDMIMRDIASAGSGMPPFMQTFTTNLDGASLATCKDNLGATVTCPIGPTGAKTDELEILANPNGVAAEEACWNPGSSGNVRMRLNTTSVTANQVVMILMINGTWTVRNINGGVNTMNGSQNNCDNGQKKNIQFQNGGDNTGFNLPGGLCAGTKIMNGTVCTGCSNVPGTACCNSNVNDCSDPTACCPKSILAGEIVRYRIRPGPAPDFVPNLERFASGSVSDFSGAAIPQFQVVARGIDDLQVQYTNPGCDPSASACAVDNAPVVDTLQRNYNTLIQSVLVTLSARSEVKGVAGMQTATVGPNALRGRLTSVGTPRAALNTLATPVTFRAAGWTGPSPYPSPWN